MKVKIEIDSALEETEVIIRCNRLDDAVINLQNSVMEQGGGRQCISHPREWAVMNDIKVIFGDSEEQGSHIPDGSGTLRIYGKVDFGDCEIRYL